MATTPNYEGAKRSGSIILDNGNGTTVTAAVMEGGSNGTRVKEIRVHSAGSVAPGSSKILAVVLQDDTNQTIIDLIPLANTLNLQQAVRTYDNVFLVNDGCLLKFQMLSALTSGATLHCEVFGANF